MVKVFGKYVRIMETRQYTIPEVVLYTGLSRRHLYDMMAGKTLPFVKPAAHRLIPGSYVIDLINKAI